MCFYLKECFPKKMGMCMETKRSRAEEISEGGGKVKERGGAERILKKLKKKARFFVLHSQIGENMSSDNTF